jgi:MbtH protein
VSEKARGCCLDLSNPFDGDGAVFLVVVNSEGQHALWPQFAAAPPGWERCFGPDARDACLDYVKKNWTDMRPKSLIATGHRAVDHT